MAESLTPLDATFLELEQSDAGAHMHIGGVMVFDPLPGGRTPSVETIRSHLEARLDVLPRFRQRLSAPQVGGLSWPSWVEDRELRLEEHVTRATLPPPGGHDELVEWASGFYSVRLDRSRPLWQMALVDGLEGGRWALATKTHHAMVDGVGSVDVAYLMLDAEPSAESPPPAAPPPKREASPADASTPPSREPASLLTTGTEIATRLALVPIRLASAALDVVARPERATEALRRSRAMAELLVRDELIAAPRSSLNVPIGGQRRLALIGFELAELKAVKNRLGGTINDVVLAGAAGGLRRLLLERGEEPPPQGLRAMVPVNIRAAGERLGLGNKITSLFVHLPVAEPDPRRRYARQMDEAEALKSGTQALGSRTLIDLTGLAPPLLHSFLARALFATRLFNVTITNVPGPQATLYALGAPMREVWPLVPIAADHCVGIAVLSYDGRVFFCVNADRDSVADLDVLETGIRDSIRELSAAPAAR
jgi:WS/DGAT/MGAT family acyltransferase